MSRLRRVNRKVLEMGVEDFPMDTSEQDKLIEKFEKENIVRDKRYINVIFGSLLIISLFYPYLLNNDHLMDKELIKSKKYLKTALSIGSRSIQCSAITLRYEVLRDYEILNKIKMKIDNNKINLVNIILIILANWIIVSHWEDLQFIELVILEIPVMIFVLTISIKRWGFQIETSIDELRGLKYEYKNV
ncbi:hypothetical protein TBLA_0G01220 [Henningerozyma blattae CBS 6284]|uniref:Uncharacterized protein n=1 Tax=Henningerozyma blattae (strain ATCC 34711 / CBS 6284 / DSM 70876 / NBRC 10599 / NRRL Y-10934 / UCD 77-7) TaxID=1071380 RepID=I2H6R7_HENB6|nr:hypothetical protein TBLA_0G01220 [Tetrapisispora blattae CBS 6284]CCH62069.1 hypothetical protein TBLA_0G01220 [Tetrapisispora blattae CBS 6284]